MTQPQKLKKWLCKNPKNKWFIKSKIWAKIDFLIKKFL
jgi:hypothetical protein